MTAPCPNAEVIVSEPPLRPVLNRGQLDVEPIALRVHRAVDVHGGVPVLSPVLHGVGVARNRLADLQPRLQALEWGAGRSSAYAGVDERVRWRVWPSLSSFPRE